MSEALSDGCTCRMYTSHGIPPCHWCEGLTLTEVAILDDKGYEVLRWLQTHYLLVNGEWDFDPTSQEFSAYPDLPAFVEACLQLATLDLAAKKVYPHENLISPPSLSLEEKITTLKDIEMRMKNPPRAHIFPDGMMLPKVLIDAKILSFPEEDTSRKARKRRAHFTNYGGLPKGGEVIPLKRRP